MSPQRPPSASRHIAALLLTATLNPINSTMIAVALPAIAVAFDVSAGTVTTGLVTSYLLVNIVGGGPAGGLGDRLGRRRALRLGQGALALGAVVGGLSPTLAGVVAGRILTAAGGAMVIPTVMASLRESIEAGRRARVFGAVGSVMGISAAVGPLVGGLLTAQVGWRAIFLVNAPVLAIAWLLDRTAADPTGDRERGRTRLEFDGLGTALLAIGLGAIVAGLKLPLGRWPLLALGAGTMIAFVAWERRAAAPLIDPTLFRERHFVAGALVIALQNLAMYALMFQLPFLLGSSLGIGPGRVGPVLMTMMIAMVVAAPLGGRLSERIGVRQTVLVGLITSVAGLGVGLGAMSSPVLAPILVCLAGLGTGLGLVTGPVQAAALSAIPPERGGVASGVLSTLRYLGGVVGVTIIAALVGDETGRALAGHRLCFIAYLGAHVIALTLAYLLPTRPRDERLISTI